MASALFSLRLLVIQWATIPKLGMYHDRVHCCAQMQGPWAHPNEPAVSPWGQVPRAVVDPLEGSDTIRQRCFQSIVASSTMHFSSGDQGAVQLTDRTVCRPGRSSSSTTMSADWSKLR